MTEKIGNYSEADSKELWDAWSNQLAVERPELAEEIVRNMIEEQEDGTE